MVINFNFKGARLFNRSDNVLLYRLARPSHIAGFRGYDKGQILVRLPAETRGLKWLIEIDVTVNCVIIFKEVLHHEVSYRSLWPAPMAHSYRPALVTWKYHVRIPVEPDICHRGCA